ncbi:retention module-containing protein [Polaromonas sp. P1(28)-8]|nr:retention module-containing protein [Polaromonas sp. P1(28)-8]
MAQFATVAAITGNGSVLAVDVQGRTRVLKVGDTLQKGETVRTVGDVRVELLMEDGSLLAVAPAQSIRLDENVVQSDQRPTAQDSAVTTPATADAVIQALERGTDLNQSLEATAAGLAPGGGVDGGSTFVQLLRIAEGVTPLAYEYNFVPPELQPDIEAIPEPVVEPGVSVGVTVGTQVGVGEGEPGLITGDIIQGTVSTADVIEGSGGGGRAVTFLITLDKVSTTDVTVTYTIVPGTATNPADYFDGAATGTVTIPAGYIGFTVTENIVGDILVEGNETFTIVLSNPIGATLINDTATVTIIDDDHAPVAIDDSNSLTEDQISVSGNVLPNDTDVDGQTLSVVGPSISVTNAFGTLVIDSATGAYTFTVNEATQAAAQALDDGESINMVFPDVYQVTDGANLSNLADVSITITGTNDGPTITADPGNPEGGNDVVYESGLAAGSDAAASSEFAFGTFTVSDADGLDDIQSVTINGVTVAIGSLVGQSFAGTNGTLTVTAYDAGTGIASYTYELTSPTTDVAGTETDVFTLTTSDGTATSAPAAITIEIIDDVPDAVNDGPLAVAEDTPLVINAFGNDVFGADGVDTDNSPSTVVNFTQGTKGTVSYDALTGQFTYTPNGGADGADSFTYTITDGDGDSDTATVSLLIGADSTPQIGAAENLTVDEDGFVGDLQTPANVDSGLASETNSTESLTDSGQVTVNFGNDVPANLLAAIALVDNGSLDGQLTSKGQPVTFALVAGDLVGTIDGGATEVIRIEITGAVDNGDGTVTYSYSTTLSEPVQQPDVGDNENSITLSGVDFTVTDSDGDPASASFDIAIVDDVPVQNSTTVNISVDEDELTGLSTGVTDGDGTTTVASFTAAQLMGLVAAGADVPVKISFNSAIEGVDTGLDSKGANILFDYVDATHVNGVADGRIVFTLVQTAGGDALLGTDDDVFTFTLLDQVDHTPLATGGGDAETIALSLASVFVATDFDGDSVVIDAGATVTIENDVPGQNSATVNINVDEDELTGLSTGITDGDGTTTVASFTAAQLMGLVAAGADEPVKVSFNSAIEGVDTGLDSKGANILFDYVDATHVNGVADGRIVFTLVQTAGGDALLGTADDVFTFTLLDQVDHTPLATGGGDAETIALSLASVFVATDFDGDSVIIDAGATVTIENDVPVFYNPTDGLLANSDSATVTASLNSLVAMGADEYVSGTNVIFDAAQEGASTLTSGGGTIYYWVSSDGKTLTASTSSVEGSVDASNTVFTVAINDATDQYTVTMSGMIDNSSGVSFENLSGTGEAGNPGFKIVESTTSDDLEILFTPLGTATSVNSDSDDVAVGSQFIIEDDGLRVDFGKFHNNDQGTGTGQDDVPVIDDKSTINGFRFSLNQISGGTTATVMLAAYDAEQPVADQNLANDTEDNITRVEVYSSAGSTVPIAVWENGVATGDLSISFTENGNFVTVSGLLAGYSIATFTDDGYDSIQIMNDATDETDGKFSLSDLEVSVTDAGDPVHQSFDTILTDADGDTSTGTIDVTFAPDGAILGTSGNDDLTSSATVNSDVIFGGDGNDILVGGGGNDILEGGHGNDSLTGGAGADVFRWSLGDQGTTGTPAADVINDFTLGGGGDVLDLRDLLQGELAGTGAASATSLSQYLHFSEVGGKAVLSVDPDGGSFAATQTITFDNMSLDGLKSGLGLAVGATNTEIIQKLLDNGNLNNTP